jgi:hypothetical protein
VFSFGSKNEVYLTVSARLLIKLRTNILATYNLSFPGRDGE